MSRYLTCRPIKKKCTLMICMIVIVGVGGCQFGTVYKSPKNGVIEIDGAQYLLDANGAVILSESELEKIKRSGSAIQVKQAAPNGALELSPEEFSVLLEDEEAFYAAIDGPKSSGKVTALVGKGSLKSSVERFMVDNGWLQPEWNALHDYYVSEPFAVVGTDIQSLVSEMVANYPLYIFFESDKKAIILDAQDLKEPEL